MEKTVVTRYTSVPSILFVSGASMAETQTALIISRLNAALPTMVDGPSVPAKKPSMHSSVADSRISGADEPSAINERFAMVPFQVLMWNFRRAPLWTSCQMVFSELVISSMAAMNWSQTIPTPMKTQRRPRKYSTERSQDGQDCSYSPKAGRRKPPELHGRHVRCAAREQVGASNSFSACAKTRKVLAKSTTTRSAARQALSRSSAPDVGLAGSSSAAGSAASLTGSSTSATTGGQADSGGDGGCTVGDSCHTGSKS
mmetsp:Transcript_5229/g.13440  ORF Transcript_5229/g.13440 Transcript_5229/m.13440 type:complete len:257 (+) Transcript_5229:713-1483(+)